MVNDLMAYTSNSNEVVNIIFVLAAEDMQNPTIYKPKMTHQIFDKETIFGYTDLKINLYFCAHTYHCYIEVLYDLKWENDRLNLSADDIIEHFQDWLRDGIVLDKDEFLNILKRERKDVVYGDTLQRFPHPIDDQDLWFASITKCSLSEKSFVNLHKRFQSLIIMYIDAANYIDITDPNWHVIYLWEERKLRRGIIHYYPIGFCTFYIFHYKKTARISQFFIIPKFQRKGLGTTLLNSVNDYLNNLDLTTVEKITVESPNEIFTTLRDKVDAVRFMSLPQFKKKQIEKGFTSKMENLALECFKVNKKQTRHIYEILRCHYSKPGSAEFEKFKSEFIEKEKQKNLDVTVGPDLDDTYLEIFQEFVKSIDKVLKYLEKGAFS